uniref:Uncharacterized protein n=1 Tax=Candidatus Kentrum sp. LFY TaxID=2126342 RepID=A0A450U6S0_9GAMM|nr:MAG: hypothetical protein BECKLFY1418B_GA0070995_100634 [Candidatus Kentron sp. LFY]
MIDTKAVIDILGKAVADRKTIGIATVMGATATVIGAIAAAAGKTAAAIVAVVVMGIAAASILVYLLVVASRESERRGERAKDDPLRDLYPLLCCAVDHMDQCYQVEDHFFLANRNQARHSGEYCALAKRNPLSANDVENETAPTKFPDRGVFFIEGTGKDQLEALPNHLAMRQKPEYGIFGEREGACVLVEKIVESVHDIRGGEDALAQRLYQRFTGEYRSYENEDDPRFGSFQRKVQNWVDGATNKRSIIHVPIRDETPHRELIPILSGAKAFVDALPPFREGHILIVLFCFEKTYRSLGILSWIQRCRRRRKLAAQGILLLEAPFKFKFCARDWIGRFPNDLFPRRYRRKLESICGEKFESGRKWCCRELQRPLEKALAQVSLESSRD